EVAAFDAEASAAPAPVPLEVPAAPAVPAAPEAAPDVPTPAVPTPAAAPESAGVFAPFDPAPRSVVAETRVLDDVRTATPAVMRYAREALAAEGPIELDRLCRTIAARFGLTRVVQ